MRSVGPSVYLVHFKPRSLVSREPSQEWPEPFRDGHCLHAALNEDELDFKPLGAVSHWLRCEWIDASAVFGAELEADASVPEDLAKWWAEQYEESVQLWLSALGETPTEAMSLVENCLLRPKTAGCPPREPEPERWASDARDAMCDFIRIFMLSRVWETAGKRVEPAPQGVRHATGPHGEWVSYVWGRGVRARQVAQGFLEAMEKDPAIGAATDKVVVLLMGPTQDMPNQAELTAHIDLFRPITKQSLPGGSLQPSGDVVGAKRLSPRFIYPQSLEGALTAPSKAEAIARATDFGVGA